MKHRSWLFGCLVILQFHVPAGAAEQPRPQVGPPPDWVLPERSNLVVPAASDAPVLVLLSDQQVRLTTEAVETFSATRLKIQNRQGLDAVGTLWFAWKPDSDVLTIHRLTLVRDGQSRDLLEGGDALTVLRREDQLEQAILTGMLTAVIQPAGLRVGDVIEMSHTLRRRDPVVHDSPDTFYMWGNSAVSNARLRVVWPESLPLRWKASTHMPSGTPAKADGWLDLTYELDETVPLLQPTGAPARFAALRTLELTTYQDWQALSRRLAPLYVDAAKLAPGSPLRAEAERIRREHRGAPQRAAAALRLVQDEIRYVLLAMNDGGLKPAAVEETWQRRFGDCKAKSVMLVALLRELGIESEVVAVSTGFGDGLDAALPGIVRLDHVLVRAHIEGKTYWLDGTRTGDRALAKLQPPPYHWGLPLTTRGSGLVPIPREPLQEPTGVLSLHVDASKGINIPAPFKAELTLTGDGAQALQRSIEGLPEANREEGLRTFWRRLYRGIEIAQTDAVVDEEEGHVTWTSSGTLQMEWDPDYDTYQPHDMGVGYRADFTRPRGTDAEAPYAVNFPDYTRTVEVIKLPPQRQPFTVTGTDIQRTVAGVEHRRTARVENNVFTAERIQRSVAPEFPASERVEAERVLLEMSRNTLYLKRPKEYLPTAGELRSEAEDGFDEPDHYVSLATDMMQRGLLHEALDAYSKALELDPRHTDALTGRAWILAGTGERAAAVADMEAALQTDPENARIGGDLADMLMSLQQWEKAAPLLDRLLARNPDAKLRARRAVIYQRQGDANRALQELDAGLQTDPKSRDLYFAKALLLMEARRDDELPALTETFHKALGSEGNAAREAASLLLALGKRKLARPYLDEDLRLQPNADSYINRSELQEDRAAAVADLRAALELPDVTPAAEEAIGSIFLGHLWYRELVDVFTARESLKTLRPQMLAKRGIARWKLGDQAGARKDFEAAAAGSSNLNNLCWDKTIHNVALDLALKECDGALAAEPECAACMDSRGLVLLRLGRLEESVREYDRALQLRPRQPTSLYGRGVARIRMGQQDAGRQDLEAARAISPSVAMQFEAWELDP